jgi:hypothetical protein
MTATTSDRRQMNIDNAAECCEIDHPLIGHLPSFTSSEIGILGSRYPELSDTRTQAVKDHRLIENGQNGVLLHFPHAFHPCGMCRAELLPAYEHRVG